MNTEICPTCGIETEKIEGPTHKYLKSTPGCWKAYGEILAKEYSDAKFFKFHDLTVDAYALQHPGRESKQTINSANIHLASLYAYFENNNQPHSLSKVKQLLAQHNFNFKWLDPPCDMTEINVNNLTGIDSPEEYFKKLEEWARFVFEQWKDHHKIASEHLNLIGNPSQAII